MDDRYETLHAVVEQVRHASDGERGERGREQQAPAWWLPPNQASCLRFPAAATQAPDLAVRWQLWLADWGYNTEEERAAAAALPGVRRLTLPQFCELLTWGCVSGVDDGCEPTPEEVEAGLRQS